MFFTKEIRNNDLIIYTGNNKIIAVISDVEESQANIIADEVLNESGYVKGDYFTAQTDEDAQANIIVK